MLGKEIILLKGVFIKEADNPVTGSHFPHSLLLFNCSFPATLEHLFRTLVLR